MAWFFAIALPLLLGGVVRADVRCQFLHRLRVDRRVVDGEELLFVEDHLLAAQANDVVYVGQLDRIDRTGGDTFNTAYADCFIDQCDCVCIFTFFI